MSNYVSVKDLNGNIVNVDFSEIIDVVRSKDFMLFGMSFDNIVDLRKHYEIRGGKMPVTSAEIDRVFTVVGQL